MIRSTFIWLLCILTGAFAALSSNQNGCELRLGSESRGSIAMIAPSLITANNTLTCVCPADRVVEIVSPDGSLVSRNSSVNLSVMIESDTNSSSVSISPTSGLLPEGIYTCRVNEQDELFAYVLETTNSSVIPGGGCAETSLDPLERSLSIMIIELAPENLCCFLDGSEIVVDPVLMFSDRSTRPITTTLSVPFVPTPLDMGALRCNFTGGLTTFQFMCSYTSSINFPPNLQSEASSQVIVGDTASTSPQIAVNMISQSMPLWCQGSNSSQSISWTTPNGETISSGNSNSSIFGVISTTDALGIFPADGSVFPEGFYTCLVDGQSLSVQVNSGFESPSIIDGTQSCQIQNDPSRLILSATATNGLLSVLNCTPTTLPNETIITLVDSTTYNVTASFSPFTLEQSYSCIASNDAGTSQVEITCEVLGIPANFTGVRNATDPSIITFSWQSLPSSTDNGYTITIFSPNGSILQTVPISSQTQNSVDVTGLDPQQEVTATIEATSASPASLTSASSDPIIVPTASTSPSENDMCMPGNGYKFNLCLKRLRNAGEDNSSCDCDNVGFRQAAIDQFLQSDCINSGECSSPMILSDESTCKCKSPSKKESSKMKNKKPKKGREKSIKMNEQKEKTKEKTRGKMNETLTENMVEVCLEGTLLCGSCNAAETMMNRGRRNIQSQLRFKRKPKKEKSPTKEKSASFSSLGSVCQSDGISVEGNQFSVEKFSIKKGKERNFYCGNTIVTETDKCDCPDNCSI